VAEKPFCSPLRYNGWTFHSVFKWTTQTDETKHAQAVNQKSCKEITQATREKDDTDSGDTDGGRAGKDSTGKDSADNGSADKNSAEESNP